MCPVYVCTFISWPIHREHHFRPPRSDCTLFSVVIACILPPSLVGSSKAPSLRCYAVSSRTVPFVRSSCKMASCFLPYRQITSLGRVVYIYMLCGSLSCLEFCQTFQIMYVRVCVCVCLRYTYVNVHASCCAGNRHRCQQFTPGTYTGRCWL